MPFPTADPHDQIKRIFVIQSIGGVKTFPRAGQGFTVRIASSIACDTQENTFNNLQTRPREK
jgi:hypothetical protein